MAAVFFSFLLCYCANQVTKGLFRAKVIFNLVPANEAGQANLLKDKKIWWIERHLWIPYIKDVFFFGTFISFLNPPSEWLQNFALTIAFSLGSNSILREDPSSPMACFCATNLFLLSFGVSLWTGEAAGFCASVFETQQGEYRLQFLCLHFFAGSCWKALNNSVITRSYHSFINMFLHQS